VTGGPVTPLLVIGDPALNRTQLFVAAARAAALSVDILPYAHLLKGDSPWPKNLANRLVRIESPGRDFEVHRHLLLRGAAQSMEPAYSTWPEAAVLALEPDPGRIFATRQWYLGWRALLAEIAAAGAEAGAAFYNDPGEIAVMFDKPACHAVLQQAGVPVPEALPPPRSLDELLTAMRAKRWGRAFLKPSHGSAASGVAALAVDAGRLRLHTAVELAGDEGAPRLYATRRLRVYDDAHEICRLVDALCRERLHVERWIPKAGLAGRTFDARAVVIEGRACHVLLRLASGPVTNLHLGAEKAGEDALAHAAGPAVVALLRATAARAAACFPRSRCVGVDVALTPDFRRAYVLEVNAFGDLLEDWPWRGADTYTWQLRALTGQGWPLRESEPSPA
jgi:hypothetical protein